MSSSVALTAANLEKLFSGALASVAPKEQEYKTQAQVEKAKAICDLQDKQEDLEIKRDRRKKRNKLSWCLLVTAIGWLIFSAVIIILIGCNILVFTDFAVVTFIAGSLAEVFGLWKIALQYFFSDK